MFITCFVSLQIYMMIGVDEYFFARMQLNNLNNLKFLTNLYTCDSVGDSFVAEKYLYAGYNNLLKFTTDIL